MGEYVAVLSNDRPYRKEISWPTLTMISIDYPQELAVRVGGLGTGDRDRHSSVARRQSQAWHRRDRGTWLWVIKALVERHSVFGGRLRLKKVMD